METIKILSTSEHKGKDIVKSAIWTGERYHKEDVTEQMLKNGKQWYEYHVKFENTVPIQLTKTNKLRKPLEAK